MWYLAESTVYPSEIDDTSSAVYTYVRKNVREEQRTDEMTDDTITVYVFEEIKLPKDVFEIFRMQTDTEDRVTDVEDIIADMLFGGDES